VVRVDQQLGTGATEGPTSHQLTERSRERVGRGRKGHGRTSRLLLPSTTPNVASSSQMYV
jgi:hypothetical protein